MASAAANSLLRAFLPYELRTGERTENLDATFPTRLSGYAGGRLQLGADDTHYGYVFAGQLRVELTGRAFDLYTGMYFSTPGATVLKGDDRCRALIVTRCGYGGFFQMGGPIEARGRLRYIDGCTDSLLLAPPVLGDPCLNHLHIPAGTSQTQHTHPSVRVGIIARGRGRCVTPSGAHPLREGLVFVIQPDCEHSFVTDDESIDVVVYHPDSDFGPRHQDHPMLNRTIIEKRAER